MTNHRNKFPMDKDRMLLLGDNLDLMGRMQDNSVDLIYLDPPFNSQRDYFAIFKSQNGEAPVAQADAFEDTWKWSEDTVRALNLALQTLPAPASAALAGFKAMLERGQGERAPLLAYLVNMGLRLNEMYRVLKPTGQLYFHCDPSAGHYIKVLLDAIFGPKMYLNEIIWHYQTSSGSPNYWLHRNHDLIFRYANGPLEGITWNHPKEPWPESTLRKWQKDEHGRIYRLQNKFGKRYYIDPKGKLGDDVWEYTLSSRTHERLGYPTQKPLWLLDRIIRASSNPGDVVLDPFLGGGTTAVAAEAAGRKWIGMDVAMVAFNVTRRRLIQTFGEEVADSVYVDGHPTTLDEAKSLAQASEYNFQVWVCDVLDAAPNKRGADGGVDGRLVFPEVPGAPDMKLGIISVKSGKVQPRDVRELANRVTAQGAELGVFVTLNAPSPTMLVEAAEEGDYEVPGVFEQRIPRVQILTVQDLLDGKRPELPHGANQTLSQIRGMLPPDPKTVRKAGAEPRLPKGVTPDQGSFLIGRD